MDFIDKTLLLLHFPHFSRPNSSRFENLFHQMTKNEKCHDEIVSYIIYPEKIIQGSDKRSSIVIKNIPKNIRKEEIKLLVEKYANINFCVLSPDSSCDFLTIAYINVINYKNIVPLYMGLRKHIFRYKKEVLDIEILYSNIQGKEEMKKIFSNNNCIFFKKSNKKNNNKYYQFQY